MGVRTKNLVPLSRSVHKWLASPHTITDLRIRLYKKRLIKDEEATSRIVTEALGAPNLWRMAQANPCSKTQGGLRGHR